MFDVYLWRLIVIAVKVQMATGGSVPFYSGGTPTNFLMNKQLIKRLFSAPSMYRVCLISVLLNVSRYRPRLCFCKIPVILLSTNCFLQYSSQFSSF